MSFKRYHIRKAIVKEVAAEIARRFGAGREELLEGNVELIRFKDGREVFSVDGSPVVFKTQDGIFPTLASIERIPLKRVVVDMGAVPHVAGGADIMAPGVVLVDEKIEVGEAVVVVDERHGKPLAVGSALVPGTEMIAPKGKVVKNLHYVGDELWRLQEKG